LRYEELKQNTPRELGRVAEFLQQAGFTGIDASPEKLVQAGERSSPERMRALEQEQARQYRQLKKTRLDKPFVRSAKSGGWRSALSEASVALIESTWGELMEELGYPLSQTLQEAGVDRE
jgi:aldehyde:ferredoxin oxidoreductase